MPKGVYLRNISEDHRNKLRENVKKALEARIKMGDTLVDNPATREAKSRNAQKATSVRVARNILKNCPIGAKPGDRFRFNARREYVVLDPAPIKTKEDNLEFWAQRFEETILIDKRQHYNPQARTIRIVWDYKPTLENILISPILEEMEENGE